MMYQMKDSASYENRLNLHDMKGFTSYKMLYIM